MSGRSIAIKRSELYEKAWSTPIAQLAKEFGISDVALGKTCKRHNIPKPGLGYWSKLRHGKKVKKTALPASKDGDYKITITASERPDIRTEDSDPEQIEQSDHLMRQINMDNTPPPIYDSLDNAHKYVQMAYHSLRNARKDESGILTARTQKCLPIHVSPASLGRALFTMDALLKVLEKYNLFMDSESLDKIVLLGHKISFSLCESLDREEIELTDKEKREKELYSWRYDRLQYRYIPNGKLTLSIDEQCYPSGLRKTWSDNAKQKVGTHLKKFLISAIEISVHQETADRRNKRMERERAEEQRRKAKISHKRWEEQRRVQELENEVSQWVKSQQIRSYVSLVDSLVIKKYGTIAKKGSELSNWIEWATRRADIIDPLVSVETEEWETGFDKRNSYW